MIYNILQMLKDIIMLPRNIARAAYELAAMREGLEAVEEQEMLDLMEARKDEPTISHEEVVENLRARGFVEGGHIVLGTDERTGETVEGTIVNILKPNIEKLEYPYKELDMTDSFDRTIHKGGDI